VKILTEVGAWMGRNGKSIYDTDPCQVSRSNFTSFTRKGNTLYAHVHYWPGETVAIGGLKNKVLSAKLLASGRAVKFDQDDFRLRLTGLPAAAPDTPITTFALELDGEPKQDMDNVRRERPRRGA
jgi:alpha-L-fucosidase